MVTLLICVTLCGCSRSFWRNQADRDSYHIVQEKMTDPRWVLPRIDIEPDPRSRFYDPYDPDEGPLPPDDPAAHQYMYTLAGLNGYKSWHKFGRAFSVENPHWLEPFGLVPEEPNDSSGGAYHSPREKGSQKTFFDEAVANFGENNEIEQIGFEYVEQFIRDVSDQEECSDCRQPDCRECSPVNRGVDNLTLEQALELSTIHSREYQFEIEELYLAALDLTFDRFQFDVRYLGIGRQEPNADFEFSSVPNGQNWLEGNALFGISKLLPSGAQLAVELANNTLWLFTGPDQTSTASMISYSLTQPLLLGAGRKIVLEDLTQQERNVLYATRNLGRFRKQLFTDIVTGQSGYLGLLQQSQRINNERGNVERILKLLDRERALASQKAGRIFAPLNALPPGLTFPETLSGRAAYDDQLKQLYWWRGPMSKEMERIFLALSNDTAYQTAAQEVTQKIRAETRNKDVLQFETRLRGSRIALLDSQRRYQDGLDTFKIRLGLPPDMPITIDKSLLKQFELIDPKLQEMEQNVEGFVSAWADLDDESPDIEKLRKVVRQLQNLEKEIATNVIPLIEEDLRKSQTRKQTRLDQLTRKEDRELLQKDYEDDERAFRDNSEDFDKLSEKIRRLSQTVSQENLTAEQKKTAKDEIGTLRELLRNLVQSMQVNQIGPRMELIDIKEFTIPMTEAVCIGLENRLDLMNSRAAVMDVRRRVEIAANRLQAVLDIRAEGDIGTPSGSRPLDFRGNNSSFRAGIAFTAPLDQVAERNDYRAALIDYQRERRDFLAAEDNVKREVRVNWRQLSTLKENLENARQSVRSSARQFRSAVLESMAPAQLRRGDPGLALLTALDAVLGSQNRLIEIWVNYEQSRLNIYRDMGIMEIDEKGIWTDAFYQNKSPVELPAELEPPTTTLDQPPQVFTPTLKNESLHEIRGYGIDHLPPPESFSGEGSVRALGEPGGSTQRKLSTQRNISQQFERRKTPKEIETVVRGTADADGNRWTIPIPADNSGISKR
jgi:outer membrane protein TolC